MIFHESILKVVPLIILFIIGFLKNRAAYNIVGILFAAVFLFNFEGVNPVLVNIQGFVGLMLFALMIIMLIVRYIKNKRRAGNNTLKPKKVRHPKMSGYISNSSADIEQTSAYPQNPEI